MVMSDLLILDTLKFSRFPARIKAKTLSSNMSVKVALQQFSDGHKNRKKFVYSQRGIVVLGVELFAD